MTEIQPPSEERPSIFSSRGESNSGESHPGFKTEGSKLDELTGVNPHDLGITRRQLLIGGVTALAGALGVGSLLLWLTGKGTEAIAPKENPFSEQYKKELERSDVQGALRKLGLSADMQSPDAEKIKEVLYNLTTTDDYLADGTAANWQNLILHLEQEGPIAFYGQSAALAKAGCLTPNQKAIDVAACDRQHPAFKNLDAQVKAKYVTTFSAKAEEFLK